MFYKSLNQTIQTKAEYNYENNTEDLFILRSCHSLGYFEKTLLEVRKLIP